MDLFEAKKLAGILTPEELIAGVVIESEDCDASPEHIKKEKKLFEDTCKNLQDIQKMCEARLSEKDLTDEHHKQYTKMCASVEKLCTEMKEHLKSY